MTRAIFYWSIARSSKRFGLPLSPIAFSLGLRWSFKTFDAVFEVSIEARW